MKWKTWGKTWGKTWVKKLLLPHPAIGWGLFPLSLAGMLQSMARLGFSSVFTIACCALSFWGLVLWGMRVPEAVKGVQRFKRENKAYLRYRQDVQLRVNLSLHLTFACNALYALLQLGMGIRHRSAWFYAMCVYYLLMAVMRFSLLRHTRHHAAGEDIVPEWRKYRFCGVLLLIMNGALMVFTLYFVFRIRTFYHHEITTIAMAAYTFTSLTLAIVNALRSRKYGSPAYLAARIISLCGAAVSVLTLENAMLTAFGDQSSDLFRQVILGLTGGSVILFVMAAAVYMIVHAARELKKHKTQTNCKQN